MITIEQLIDRVKEIAKHRQDNKYVVGQFARCYYTKGNCSDGSCGCIFGQALVSLDPNLKTTLVALDNYPTPIAILLLKLGITGSDAQLEWCAQVQRLQDSGDLWGKCIPAESN